jgi:hypothetical protein
MADLCPDCTYVELTNNVPGSPVRGYKKTALCSACQSQLEADQAAASGYAAEQEKENLISQRQRDLAISDLQASGILDADENLI